MEQAWRGVAMTEHLTDVKDLAGPIRYEQVLRTDGDPDMRTNDKGEWVRFADHARIVERLQRELTETEDEARAANVRADQMAAEWGKLRTALTGISTCGTCEACRGAARLALGGVTPEPPCGPGDTGYTEMLERIRDEVGVEIFDMQHPHTWFRAARAAQPPGGGQQ